MRSPFVFRSPSSGCHLLPSSFPRIRSPGIPNETLSPIPGFPFSPPLPQDADFAPCRSPKPLTLLNFSFMSWIIALFLCFQRDVASSVKKLQEVSLFSPPLSDPSFIVRITCRSIMDSKISFPLFKTAAALSHSVIME